MAVSSFGQCSSTWALRLITDVKLISCIKKNLTAYLDAFQNENCNKVQKNIWNCLFCFQRLCSKRKATRCRRTVHFLSANHSLKNNGRRTCKWLDNILIIDCCSFFFVRSIKTYLASVLIALGIRKYNYCLRYAVTCSINSRCWWKTHRCCTWEKFYFHCEFPQCICVLSLKKLYIHTYMYK